MIDLDKHPRVKYLLFGNLYFANGIQASIGMVLIIIYFDEINISIATATMVAGLASIPFTLKFLFGPITDYLIKYGRRPFAIFGGLIAGVALFPLAFINPKDEIILFTAILFIGVIGIVFLDVAADAWAIQVSKVKERGKVNAAMFGSLFGGMAIGNPLLAIIADNFDYSMAFIVAGVIVTSTIILPLIVKEKKRIKIRPKIIKSLLFEFKKKNTKLVAFFGFFSALNFGLIIFIMPDYMMNFLNLSVTQTGILTTLYPIGIVLGVTTGGIMADKWGRKITLYIFLFLAIIFSSLLITANTWQIFAVIYPILGFLQGGSGFAAMMALFMDVSNPKIGATQFSILTSITNFGDYSIAIFSGALVLILGYHRFFLYAAWLVGPALLILYYIGETNK
jgi:MFS family permease